MVRGVLGLFQVAALVLILIALRLGAVTPSLIVAVVGLSLLFVLGWVTGMTTSLTVLTSRLTHLGAHLTIVSDRT